jgi:hypothetical protein
VGPKGSMKSTLRSLFAPILKFFESGEGSYSYKKSHRMVLLCVGVLFLFLSCITLGAAVVTSQLAAVIPFLVFLILGSVCLIIGGLANDRAVAKIWGNK